MVRFMNVIEQYPSTADLPRIAGGQDLVLAILQGARKRYVRGGTQETYLGKGGAVCAVGAVAREAGLKDKQYISIATKHNVALGGNSHVFTPNFGHVLKLAQIETETRNAAKKAITLLNQSARRLFPESKGHERWDGPIEWINQELGWPEARKAVLKCYDDAIGRYRARQARAAA